MQGLEHGGYVPRGRKAEDGGIDDRYNLVELSTSSYPARTRRNLEESDGTVIFSLNRRLSGGTKLTLELANKLGAEPDLGYFLLHAFPIASLCRNLEYSSRHANYRPNYYANISPKSPCHFPNNRHYFFGIIWHISPLQKVSVTGLGIHRSR